MGEGSEDFGARVAGAEEGEDGDFDFVLIAEEFEEDADALSAWEDSGDDGLLTAEGTGDDVDLFADFEFHGDGDGVIGVDGGAEVCDDGVGDGAEVFHEGEDLGDEGGGGDVAEGGGGEAGEEVAREEGFDVPDEAADGFLLVAETWAEGFEA